MSAATNPTDIELDFGELLQEFHSVVEELNAPSQRNTQAYQHVLKEAKHRSGLAESVVMSDSGVDDSESDYSSEASLGNSLSVSEEELNTAGITLKQKAKLGDTGELQSFIDSLDRELAEM